MLRGYTKTYKVLLVVAGFLCLPMLSSAQTGQIITDPKFYATDANGDPCNGCLVFFYAAGTSTKTDTYTSSGLGTANANPVVLDSAGRATVFGDPSVSYKIVLAPADDTDPPGSPIYTVDNVVGPFAGVITVTAADSRGVQIVRSSADAGLSIQSSGGSGKTYGLVSNTSGAFRIQDDSDSTPRIELTGNDINLTATGTITAAGATTISGALSASSTAAFAGALTANSTATFNGTASFNGATPLVYLVESDATANNGRWYMRLDSEQFQIRTENDASSSAASALTIDRTGTTVDSIGLAATATTNSGRYNSATLQPGFLAYNSTTDNTVATGTTVDFDTEVYDEAGNFSADTFTAPVTGRYHLCVTVTYSDNAADTYGLRLVTSARSYRIDYSGATTAGVSSGCVYADMASGATASVQVDTGDATGISIEGGTSPYSTFFSGRLVP